MAGDAALEKAEGRGVKITPRPGPEAETEVLENGKARGAPGLWGPSGLAVGIRGLRRLRRRVEALGQGAVPTAPAAAPAAGDELDRSPAEAGVVPTTEPLPTTGALVPTTVVPAAGGGGEASALVEAESLPTTPGPQDPLPTTAEEPVATSPSFPTVLPTTPGASCLRSRWRRSAHAQGGAGPARFCRPYLGTAPEAPLTGGHRPPPPPVDNRINCPVAYLFQAARGRLIPRSL